MKLRLSLSLLALVALTLAACTREATTQEAVPQATQPPVETPVDTTVSAIETQLAETQIAMGAGGGGEEPTPTPEVSQPDIIVPTATPEGAQPDVIAPTPAAAQPTALPVAPGATCPNPYTVQKGDWIYKIARACGLDPKAVIAANPGINPDRISPGQQINIPTGAAATPGPTAACTGEHIVKQGENLFRIGYDCGFTTAEMAQANGLVPPYTLSPGQVIKFP